jgi:hypothetical protein
VFSYSEIRNIKYKEASCSDEFCSCFGLVKLLYEKEYNILLPDYHERFKTVNDGERQLTSEGKWKRIAQIDFFPSITVMDLHGEYHVGYNISRFQFVHIRKSIGYPVFNKIYDLAYKDKIRGFYKYVTE